MFHPFVLQIEQKILAEKRRSLLDKGYVVFEKLLDPDGVARVLEELQQIMNRPYGSDDCTVLRDEHGFVAVMNGLDKASDFLFDLARRPELLSMAEGLLAKRVVPLHTEYFAKPPLRPSNESPVLFPSHQDHAFYHNHFGNEMAISVWIALDDVTVERGAVEFGSPAQIRLLPHRNSAYFGFGQELVDEDGFTFEPVPVPRGGALIHHSFAVHRSGSNRTPNLRRAVVFNYRGSDFRQFYQPITARPTK